MDSAGRRKTPDICVSCPRRSGTHFAIDAIRNNFEPHYRLDSDEPLVPRYGGDALHLLDDDEARRFLARSSTPDGAPGFVYWTHRKSLDDLLGGENITDPRLRDQVRQAIAGMHFIYIYRDARDVAVSHCLLKEKWGGYDAQRAIAHMADWAESAGNWRRHGAASELSILYVSYELLKRSYEDVVRRIGSFVGLEPADPIRKVTIGAGGTKDESLSYTTRKFRKGLVGDHANYLGDEEQRYYEAHCKDLYEPHYSLGDLNS